MVAKPNFILEPSRYDVSSKLFKRAFELIAGGVNSPVRSFNAVGGTPVFIAGGEGAILQDMDENQYIDYVCSWGALIHGHANSAVIKEVTEVLSLGSSFGAPTDRETCLADYITSRHEHIEKIRLVSSGTEATMSAIRLARGYTGKDKIIKCDGCYHGASDSLLVSAGSGLATHSVASCAGVPSAIAELTTVVEYNNIEVMENAFKSGDVACVIIEPIAGNMGCIPPVEGYLEGVRKLCDEYGALLIFDEVMTGFRVGYGSAQTLYNIRPDIACFGKIVGGGMPLAAYGASAEIMEKLSPSGDIYQAGTLSGNPVAVASGMATLEMLKPDTYIKLEAITTKLTTGLKDIFMQKGIPHSINQVGSMFTLFFRENAPTNFTQAKQCDSAIFKKFFHSMLENGVYLPPSPYEACFVSTSHSDEFIAHTLSATEKVVRAL